MRAVRGFLSAFFLTLTLVFPVSAQEPARTVITTENSDYFGFDLRTEQNVSLDQCKATCVADQSCRAFTYNTKAKWCFLKSDYANMNPFSGAVAGKVVPTSGDPDIGAPAELTFVPNWMPDEARLYRASLNRDTVAVGEVGLSALVADADLAMRTNDPRRAMGNLIAAVVISPDDATLWTSLARAIMATSPANSTETSDFQRNATSASWNAYQLSRTAATRADSLYALAQGLDRRDLYRPSISAYEASLELVPSPAIQAELTDLRARKGFRVIEHTVDSDTPSPRICAVFSEDLVKTGVDYAPFVTVDDQAPKSVEAGGRQICVGGLEHGKHYRVVFRSGLPAAIGEVIESPVLLSIYVRDRAPTARFTGDSFVLPSTARRGIPVVTVNMSSAKMALYRVGDRSLAQLLSGYQFLRQLDGYDISNIAEQLGEPVWTGDLEIATELNKEVTTSFPVDEALPNRKPGVYVLTAVPADDRRDSWESRATQWFVVSDIGLSTYTGQDGLNVFARSLATAQPIANTELTLLAKNNEILGTAKTDAAGRATFTAGLTRGEGGLVPAVLMASQGSDNFVFLDMTRAGFDLSDRGVAGRAAPSALDVYAWTERGIYRVGETVHAAALARDASAKAVENLPLTFIFRRPDGVEDRRLISDGRFAGGHAVDLDLATNAMRGAWTLAIHTDPEEPAIATQQFLVEDFVPDRIEFDMTADKKEVAIGETANVTVDGRFLYGAPAAGLALEGEVKLSTKRQWDRYAGYYFGLSDEQEGETQRTSLGDLPLVGDDGKATFPVTVDQAPSTTRLINAQVSVRMREAGGRAVERSLDLAIRPSGEMIGIKPEFAEDSVPQSSTARLKIIAVDADGNRKAAPGLLWTLSRIERNYQWYRSGNGWNYEPITYTREVASGTIDPTAEREADISAAVDWGRYRLDVETADPSGPATSYEFEAGWFVEATSTETPDALEIALDKESYKPGEVAKLKISPRFAGELLVAIGSETLLTTVSATVPEGGATVDVPVGSDWGAGAYVTATLFRPGEAQESRMPARAIGVKWLQVDPGERKLQVALTPTAQMTPRQTLSIPVEVTGLPSTATDAYVTVAAVDVGILNLTNYKTPDPDGWYFGQRMMGLELRDLYGRLIDGSLGATGRLRTGGDGGGMASQGSPPTEKLIAFFSGPVKLDASGKATVDFDIPQFNGSVRIMAVAWTKDAVGHASTDVIVRDPVVLTASAPRFMAPGDGASMRLDIANTDGPAGDYALTVETTGDLSTGSAALPEKVTLAKGARQYLTIPLNPQSAGTAGLTIRLAHADGLTVEQSIAFPVRPAALPLTTRTVVNLAANGGSLKVDGQLLAASLLDGAYVSVGVTPVSAFDVPSLLMTLDRYPYGCAEQTTSRALPLLYVSELASQAGIPEDPSLRERIQGAIYRVLNYQSSSGSFGLWSPGYGDLWLDSYVTDFLTRARELNYEVPTQAMQQAVNNLQNALAYDVDLTSRNREIAYALYVLARNKKASIGDLRYYADTQIGEFDSPMGRAQIAASLALYGDAQRAESTFASALELARATASGSSNWYRSDYGSTLRDGAAMLALAAETRPVPASITSMVDLVAAERKKVQWTSTQDEAWMLLAARAIKSGTEAISLNVNGTAHTGAWSTRVTGQELADSPITVANLGPNPVEAVVTAVAAPAEPLPAGGNGFTIERAYYTLDGEQANVTEAKQNERYVAVLKMTEASDWPSRVLITDLLPAGFQIDNPRIVNSADLANFDWLPETQAATLEFRGDRFVAAFDRQPGADRSVTVAYVVRAVTPGTYAHPAARVEDMYRPQFSANTASGMMQVVE